MLIAQLFVRWAINFIDNRANNNYCVAAFRGLPKKRPQITGIELMYWRN